MADALTRVRKLCLALPETTERLSETQQRLTGTIRLVGGMTVSIYVFPTLLKEFQRLHPDVDVKVMTGPADRLVRRLRAGTVDLGLLTLPVTEPDLVTRHVMREELQMVTYLIYGGQWWPAALADESDCRIVVEHVSSPRALERETLDTLLAS